MEGDNVSKVAVVVTMKSREYVYFTGNAYRIWWGNLLVKGLLDDCGKNWK